MKRLKSLVRRRPHLKGDGEHGHAVHLTLADALVMQGAAVGAGVDLGLHAGDAQAGQGDVLQPADEHRGAVGHGAKVAHPAAGGGRGPWEVPMRRC
ncbi:MAG: hypothetical protein IPO79_13685 [Flavobacteriales bacterium]|nr:hypothetical protein [Flavobacteriales bacterium]